MERLAKSSPVVATMVLQVWAFCNEQDDIPSHITQIEFYSQCKHSSYTVLVLMLYFSYLNQWPGSWHTLVSSHFKQQSHQQLSRLDESAVTKKYLSLCTGKLCQAYVLQYPTLVLSFCRRIWDSKYICIPYSKYTTY